MRIIIEPYTSKYDVGDVVVFEKEKRLIVGIVEGFYVDHNCDDSFWYNIRVNSTTVYTYSNHGDISENSIIGKLDGILKEECFELLRSNLSD